MAQDLPAQASAVVEEQAEEEIAFEADAVEYASDTDTVTAGGDVVLRRGDQSVRADSVTWNRVSGEIVALGNVRLVDEDGNQFFSDRVELTEELRTGAVENLLLALREGGRLAAVTGERNAAGEVILNRAAYTACEVETEDGCPKSPSWRITAKRVVYDPDDKVVRFRGAKLELFGALTLPLPGLSVTTDGRATSGFLIPDLRFSPSNGAEISESYYARLAPNRDLTATAYVYTEAPPMASFQYRALTDTGAYQITGYATESRRIPIFGATPGAERDLRGYVFANGRFQLDERWSVTGSLRRSTDRTFLRRYDLSRDDRLRSTIDVERISSNSYFSLAGWATQTMRVGEDQGQVPVALPVVDFRYRMPDPVMGGNVELQANSLAILRTEGQDTQRAFVRAQWDMRRLTSMGQEVTLTAMVRGDVYHSDENALTDTVIYRGNPGWETRGVALAALDVKWPLVGSAFGGTQVLTPRFQLVASPEIRNLNVPNEDARAVDLEDSNLFALNRFPGYDRVEEGVRFTYGVDWQFERPRWRIKTTVGQSVRLSRQPTLLPDGTGLSNRVSDVVGRTEVRYRDFINLVHRFRLDKDSFAIRRNEFDAVIGSRKTYAEIGYVRLNRDIAAGIEDLQDREELRAAGRIAFANYWSVFGSAIVNLTDRSEDPSFGSDGFQPLRSRLGIAYQDDCLEIAVTWRRDYVATGDAERGNSFQIRFALRNLGFR
ncbi:LPS-assembly protein LptD [Novosphingobium marinum]|uniref:LPS-assembly protein LptD n=2 Tax=Novosphingobium marinum TaxID=1514948 RepID=A0A7Y9XXT4_9SPHN|nr:LPS assembly protein LptD [Novosphingobium marinum]NYH96527.1 LPS-assembly protein [Novosphingobium marinum]GGC35924.1 LPS-assembly protein LptD [Novosphingobium marinum]